MPPTRSIKKRYSDTDNDNELSTANFDVGGTPFKVSRSLLEQHPDTMLTRMASETWQSNPEDPLFVERDGERFRYVLDYMRDGQVSLPGGKCGVTKTSIFNELTYYGFANVDPECISSEFTNLDAAKYIARLTEEHTEELAILTRQRDEKNMEVASSIVAHAACVRYMTTGNPSITFATATISTRGGYTSSHDLLTRDGTNALDFQVAEAVNKLSLLDAALNTALSKYGLSMSYYQQTSGLCGLRGKEENCIIRVTMNLSSL